jgi:hypothetical protein
MYIKIETEANKIWGQSKATNSNMSNNKKGIVMELCQGSLVEKFQDLNWQITENLIIEIT